MFKLFTEKVVTKGATVIDPGLRQVRIHIQAEVKKAISYYQESNKFVENSHLLVRLLQTMPAPVNSDIRSWYYSAEDMVSGLDTQLGILSDTNGSAKIHSGNFMGQGVGEIYLDYRAEINFVTDLDKMLTLSPIRILYHPYTTLRHRPLDGDDFGKASNGDFAVIGIDIALLYTQYHLWWRKKEKEHSPDSIHKFIYAYPMANAVCSFIDVAVYNRIYNLTVGLPNSPHKTKLPYAQVDYTNQLDAVLRKQIETMKRTPMSYRDCLRHMPAIFEDDQFHVMRLPKVLLAKQTRWTFTVARLKVTELLLAGKLGGGTGENNYYTDEWKHDFGVLRTDRSPNLPTTIGIESLVKEITSFLFK